MGIISQLADTLDAAQTREDFFEQAAQQFDGLGTTEAAGIADLVRRNPDAAAEIARQFGGWQGLFATHREAAGRARLESASAMLQHEQEQRRQAGQPLLTDREVLGRMLPHLIQAGMVNAQTIGQLGRSETDERAAEEHEWSHEDRPLKRDMYRAQIESYRRAGGDASKPPSGYRWRADGALEAIPGGPGDPKREAPTMREQVADEVARVQLKIARGEKITRDEDRVLRGHYRQFPGYAGDQPMPWEDLVEDEPERGAATPAPAAPPPTPRANPPRPADEKKRAIVDKYRLKPKE